MSSEPFHVAKKYFKTPIQEFVYYDKYSRFNNKKGRRETWPETVFRTVNYLRELSNNKLDESDYRDIYDGILNMQIAPSMRLMATAGDAARRAPESLYNCCYIPINSIEAITELLWVSMCGVGAGYSVEERYVNQMPQIKWSILDLSHDHEMLFQIPDTTEGWIDALKLGMQRWMDGKDVTFDYSLIRPAGTVLTTKGGTASGPKVLADLLNLVRRIIQSRAGKKLQPIDVFDICTKIGDAAVSGGSRRSAQLCMFDYGDKKMMRAKAGEFWAHNPHRTNANISAVIERELSSNEVAEFLGVLFDNQSGEPGWASRRSMNLTKPPNRRHLEHGGGNACFEINLHGATKDGRFGGQFCNLSTINVYPDDDITTLESKAKLATIVGTIQSTATDFKFLRPEWKEICDEERLLGVSMIGIMDNPIARDPETQQYLRDFSVATNRVYARKLGINPAAAITTIKPAGNSSVMYGTARGINARYSDYYIRRVRLNEHTPIFNVLNDSGISLERDVVSKNGTWVAKFYEKSPDNAITIDSMSAIDQLNSWKSAKLNWAQHNVSVTIEYYPEEEYDIIDWVYENQDILNGVAFLPRADHVYQQAPYEKITEAEYGELTQVDQDIDFSRLLHYEKQDSTSKTLECSADGCDLI